MTLFQKSSIAAIALLAGIGGPLYGQAAPTATTSEPGYNPGPSLPRIDGNFKYSLSASELVVRGGLGDYTQTVGSGVLEYMSKSPSTPFSALYSAGVMYSTLSSLGFQTFQGLTLSQGLVAGRWTMGVSDTVSYLPASPTTGLSGVAGLGNQGVLPNPNPATPAQSILTTYGRSISNSVSGNIGWQLSGRTSITGDANYGILRMIDGTGFDSTQIGSQVGINRKLSARSVAGLNLQYGVYSFTGSTSFNTRGINATFSRVMSKSLSVQGSIGPQWVSRFSSLTLGTSNPTTLVTVPASVNVAGTMGVGYTHRFTDASLTYSRGVNSGSGVQTGGLTDTLSLQIQQSFGRNWAGSVVGGFNRTSGLVVSGTTTGVLGDVQLTRRLSRSFSAYTSVTVLHQNLNSALTGPSLFAGTSETYAIGVTFSPNALRLGQF